MIEHITVVFEASGVTYAEKMLLMAYCDHTDADGYAHLGMHRLMDKTGMSERTVRRTNAVLRTKKLIKSARRVNPKTGEQITNLTRVNLALLTSMKRPPRDYGDGLIERLTFDEDEASSQVNPGGQSDPPPGQSDPPPGQSDRPRAVNLTPNPFPSSVRTDPDPEEAEAAPAEDKPSPVTVEVSAETLRQAAEIASRLDLARLDAKPKQVIQITQALAEALTHPAADAATVERYAAATVATGHKVKYLLNGLSPERLTIGLPAYRAGAAPARPADTAPHCGDPRHDANAPDDRKLYNPADPHDRGTPCPKCDPQAAPALVPPQADAPAQEMTTSADAIAIARAKAQMAALRAPSGRR